MLIKKIEIVSILIELIKYIMLDSVDLENVIGKHVKLILFWNDEL